MNGGLFRILGLVVLFCTAGISLMSLGSSTDFIDNEIADKYTDYVLQVTDSFSNMPVQNANVSLYTSNNRLIRSGLANFNGFVTFKHVMFGKYIVIIEKPGYEKLETTVKLDAGSQISVDHYFFNRQQVTISGLVLTQTASNVFYWVSDTKITFVEQTTGTTYETRSNGIGNYSISIPSGKYKINLSKPGFEDTISEQEFSDSKELYLGILWKDAIPVCGKVLNSRDISPIKDDKINVSVWEYKGINKIFVTYATTIDETVINNPDFYGLYCLFVPAGGTYEFNFVSINDKYYNLNFETNVDSNSLPLYFNLTKELDDKFPPNIILSSGNATFEYGTTNTNFFVKTDKPAICKFSNSPKDFSGMENGFITKDNRVHEASVNLATGENKIYVLCSDLHGNVMSQSSALSLTFFVKSYSGGGGGGYYSHSTIVQNTTTSSTPTTFSTLYDFHAFPLKVERFCEYSNSTNTTTCTLKITNIGDLDKNISILDVPPITPISASQSGLHTILLSAGASYQITYTFQGNRIQELSNWPKPTIKELIQHPLAQEQQNISSNATTQQISAAGLDITGYVIGFFASPLVGLTFFILFIISIIAIWKKEYISNKIAEIKEHIQSHLEEEKEKQKKKKD